MNIQKFRIHFCQLVVVSLLITSADLCLAQQPSKASYATSTTHDCVGYECTRSLYPLDTLEIIRKDLSPAQFKNVIEKHINNIQSKQTSFPGFNTTIKSKISIGLSNKALHCHKAKPQKINWRDSSQKLIQLKYRHECWQYLVTKDNHQIHRHNSIERINDITYTVSITRTPTACASSGQTVHATKFECIADYRKYSLVALDDVKDTITITIDDEEIEFALLDDPGDITLDGSSVITIVDNDIPDDDNTDSVPDDDDDSDDGSEDESDDDFDDEHNDENESDDEHQDDASDSEHDDEDHNDSDHNDSGHHDRS